MSRWMVKCCDSGAALRLDTASADYFRFVRSWMSNPLRVAAVAPSGHRLAEIMTRDISPAQAPILELGPGTGVFTRALLARGVPEADLILIEHETRFIDVLRGRFPDARILQMDAARIGRARLCDDAPIGAVVSGLPLLSMSPRQTMSILAGAFAHLGANGAFYQFTYGPRCPVPRPILDRLGLKATRIGGTLCNVPPAAAYRIARRAPLGGGGTAKAIA